MRAEIPKFLESQGPGPELMQERDHGGPGQRPSAVAEHHPVRDPLADGRQRLAQVHQGGRRVQAASPAAEGGGMGHPIGILEGGCGVFPRETLGKMQTQCFTARQEAVMRIREGEARKESKGLLADLTLAAADTNPVMILIVGLFAPTAVADDRVTVANRAMSQDKFGADGSPIRFELANRVGKWDNENREPGRFGHGVSLDAPGAEPPSLLSEKSQLERE